jgi:hypothetical protein
MHCVVDHNWDGVTHTLSVSGFGIKGILLSRLCSLVMPADKLFTPFALVRASCLWVVFSCSQSSAEQSMVERHTQKFHLPRMT